MDTACNPAVWSSFFSAEVGASAGLVGLLFVAVSINLAQIIAMRLLVARAAKALFTLGGVLIASILCMVPGQPLTALGVELAAWGFLIWVATTRAEYFASHGNAFIGKKERVLQVVVTQMSSLPLMAGGISLLVRSGGGLYWLVAGSVFSFIAALIDAWVLLIEIQR
jgi:hypothetical protein